MKYLQTLLLSVGVGLSMWLVVILVAQDPWSSFNEQGAALMSMQWGQISLIDLYSGFFLASVFVWLFEPKIWVRIGVTLALFVLGNPVLALWLVFRFKFLLALGEKGK